MKHPTNESICKRVGEAGADSSPLKHIRAIGEMSTVTADGRWRLGDSVHLGLWFGLMEGREGKGNAPLMVFLNIKSDVRKCCYVKWSDWGGRWRMENGESEWRDCTILYWTQPIRDILIQTNRHNCSTPNLRCKLPHLHGGSLHCIDRAASHAHAKYFARNHSTKSHVWNLVPTYIKIRVVSFAFGHLVNLVSFKAPVTLYRSH